MIYPFIANLKRIIHEKGMAQLVKFVLVGILNTIVGYGTYVVFLYFFHAHYILSMVAANIVGTLHSFIWNKYWTFRSKEDPGKEIVKFVTVYLVSFFLNFPLLSFLVEIIHLNPYVGQAVALVLLAVVSFLGHKMWSFRASR